MPLTADHVIPVSLQSLSLPAKLIKKIQNLEFVDMAELVPESWRHQDEDRSCCHRRQQRKGPVTDILLWVECFSTMVAVLSAKYPDKTPQLMGYLKSIVKAHRTFKGEGWVTYDSCYRRNAALTKSLDWGQVDFHLYNETFAGRARPIRRCTHCNSEHHTEEDCVLAPDSRYQRDKSFTRTPSARPPSAANHLCQLFNAKYGNKCYFNSCKFAHKCMECRGNHPISSCNRGRPPPAKVARSGSPHSFKK